MRIGKKDPNNLLGKDIWTEVASTASEPIILEPSKLILNGDGDGLTSRNASHWDYSAVHWRIGPRTRVYTLPARQSGRIM